MRYFTGSGLGQRERSTITIKNMANFSEVYQIKSLPYNPYNGDAQNLIFWMA